MTYHNLPIIGHPHAKIWRLQFGTRAIAITIFKSVQKSLDSLNFESFIPVDVVNFTHRQINLDTFLNPQTPFEFLAPSEWTMQEALWCAFTGEQPIGREVCA